MCIRDRSNSIEKTVIDYEGNYLRSENEPERRKSVDDYRYNENKLKEFKISKQINRVDGSSRIFITKYIYFQDTLLSQQIGYSSDNPKDSLETEPLEISNLDKYHSRIKSEVKYEFIGDTIVMSHFLSEKLFATEEFYKTNQSEYCEVNYAGHKGNKQINIIFNAKDTTFKEAIQYKLEGEKEIPDYKIVSIETDNEFLSQKIDLATNEIIQEDKTVFQLDDKGNWIKSTQYKNGEFRYETIRKITYY